jgi:hypothetical protein
VTADRSSSFESSDLTRCSRRRIRAARECAPEHGRWAPRTMKALLSSVVLIPTLAWSAHPDCAGRWPTTMAYVHLKNAGIVVEQPTAKTTRLASEQIGPDLYRQVHLVSFPKGSKSVKVITINDASSQECSMSEVQAFVVSQELGP